MAESWSQYSPLIGRELAPILVSDWLLQTVVIYDRAAGRRLARLTVPGSSFPLSLSLGWSSILVGDKSGGLHLIDTTHDR